MRVALAALAVCLVVPVLSTPGAAVAASGSSAGAIGSSAGPIGPSGFYSAVSRIRALDSRVSGAIPAKATAKVQVNDVGDRHAINVVAVSVNLTVLTPAVTGSITVFADGTSWSGATMSFQAGLTNQNFETVPVGANGLIDIRNNTASSLVLIVDILGYHRSGFGDFYGEYQPMTPTRLLDTRTGQPVAAGQTRTFQVGGRGGIPAQDAATGQMGVVVNFTVLTPSRSGSLTVGGTDLAVKTSTMSFAAGQTEQGQLLELLDDSGGLALRNNSAAAVHVIADVVGYYTGLNVTDPGRFDHFFAGGHWRVYDSRGVGQAPVPPGGTVQLPIADLANGNTRDGICAPLMNVTVLTPSTGGSISAWPDSVAWDGAATITFAAHHTRQRMLMVASGDKQNVQIRNNSSAPITLIVDVKGWRSCI
jgi:hypothetical protein